MYGADYIPLRVTIEALPDNVLLDIFDFYRKAEIRHLHQKWPWPWNRLVHVCQRWRSLVFASPLRLDLCLRCTSKTRVRATLDFWPPLPFEVYVDIPYNVDDIIATLEHRNRVRKISIFNLTSSQLERLAPMMQEPFPALTLLQLRTRETAPTLPDMLLGGSAPRLQSLSLGRIPFPGLPKLLLSATDLSILTLEGIPHTGYISPEAMVTCLYALTRLTCFAMKFEFPPSRPDRRPLPLTRVVLPALIGMVLQSDNEYLEDFIARIDAPRLNTLDISIFNQPVFDISQLLQFITHTGMTKSFNQAAVFLDSPHVRFSHCPPEETYISKRLRLGIYCRGIDWQVSCAAQICSQYSFFLPSVEQLDIDGYYLRHSFWQDDLDGTPWLELFRPFTGVRTLRISRYLKSSIVHTLQELTGERAIEVLPALNSLYLEHYQASEPEQKAIEPFIAARQYSDHPVAVHLWERPQF